MADSVYRVTEVIGVSSESWEAAARNAVETAAGFRTLERADGPDLPSPPDAARARRRAARRRARERRGPAGDGELARPLEYESGD